MNKGRGERVEEVDGGGVTWRECGVKINEEGYKQRGQQWCVRSRSVQTLCALSAICLLSEIIFFDSLAFGLDHHKPSISTIIFPTELK